MPAQIVHLPNGQTYTVTPIFGGYTFKSNDLDIHHSAMPPGWTVNLQTEDEVDDEEERIRRRSKVYIGKGEEPPLLRQMVTHRFTRPTLQKDILFISSVSVPSSNDFRGPASPSRHTAMMLWATLLWYFQKDPPSPHVRTESTLLTPEQGRPKADWRIKIRKEGIFKGRNALQKLERMGLIASEESFVGPDTDIRSPEGWSHMFVSRRAFWQLDPRIFLFTLAPVHHSPVASQSPHPSRPASPERNNGTTSTSQRGSPRPALASDFVASAGILSDLINSPGPGIASPGGPFESGSHLPTYYPAPPTQYFFTNGVRHPLRPKPPRQAETFYTRYIPSLESWLSFRVPSLSPKPVLHHGPHGPFKPTFGAGPAASFPGLNAHHGSISVATLPTLANFTDSLSDTALLNTWMNNPRVNAFWGEAGPIQRTATFLTSSLSSKHSFPVFACWDGRPFGFFEIYWAKEDKLGSLLGGNVANWTRGAHVLVGEEELRGPHRVKVWLSALVHYCWLADPRTEQVIFEPRVDNERMIKYLEEAGFYKQGEVAFEHKQSAVMKIDRDSWEAPAL